MESYKSHASFGPLRSRVTKLRSSFKELRRTPWNNSRNRKAWREENYVPAKKSRTDLDRLKEHTEDLLVATTELRDVIQAWLDTLPPEPRYEHLAKLQAEATELQSSFEKFRGQPWKRLDIWQAWTGNNYEPAEKSRTALDSLKEHTDEVVCKLQSANFVIFPYDLLVATKKLRDDIQASLDILPPKPRTRPVAKASARKNRTSCAPYPIPRGSETKPCPDKTNPPWKKSVEKSGSTTRTIGHPKGLGMNRESNEYGHESVAEPRESTVRRKTTPHRTEQTVVTLVAMTKNNQGEGGQPGYCIAALQDRKGGNPARLLRLVPKDGHFWTNELLPEPLREKSLGAKGTQSPMEPPWQFRPAIVGFERGTSSGPMIGPHRNNDVVSQNLVHLGDVENPDDLEDQLVQLSLRELSEQWPDSAWASRLSILPDADVPSFILSKGIVRWITPRDRGRCPTVDVQFEKQTLYGLPYAAHRLHHDRGIAHLFSVRNLPNCLILLGLARTSRNNECRILLLRIIPLLHQKRDRWGEAKFRDEVTVDNTFE